MIVIFQTFEDWDLEQTKMMISK